MKCSLCPHQCSADRIHSQGVCHSSWTPEVAAVCVHQGEEPPLSGSRGICNVFFSHCNLRCIYCQNWQISRDATAGEGLQGVDAIVARVAEVLEETEDIVGFVTPTHYAESIPAIVEGLHARGLHPVTVYNTSGYERVETLRMLEPYVDVYLPDMKYSDSDLAQRYSHAADYPAVAVAALREMYRQKGSCLRTDERGMAFGGIIVRHLVLPGCVENSLGVLEAIADVSLNLHVSLMAQYWPCVEEAKGVDALGRRLQQGEYERVVEHFFGVGLHNGWLQELESGGCWLPDFGRGEWAVESSKY